MRLSSLFLFLCLLAACTPKSSKVKNLVVVQVLEQKLYAVDFSQRLTNKLKNLDAAAARNTETIKKIKNELIHNFILNAVVKDFAKKNNIKVSSSEVDAEVDLVRKSYPNDLSFKESLAHADLLLAEWRQNIEQTLLQKKVMFLIFEKAESKPTYSIEELKKYYQSHINNYNKGAEVRVSQIVVKTQDEAQKLLKSIRSGSNTFEDVAKKFSLSPDSKKGGDIGFIIKGVVPVFDVAFNMSIGPLSPVIKSEYGFHILKVTAKKPATKISFEQAKPSIIKALNESAQAETFNRWFSEYIKGIKIEKDSALIDNIHIQTQGSFE